MNKIVMVSFFKSNNLGDVVLSKSLYEIYNNSAAKIQCYDFTTISKVKPQTEITNRSEDSYLTLKGQINSRISKVLKSSLYTKITFFIKRYTTDYKRWSTFSEALKGADEIVIGGGNMLMDIDETWPLLISEYVRIAKKNNKKVYISHVGVGPLNSYLSKKLISNLRYSIEGISVRDLKSSNELVNSLNYNEEIITITADPAFSLYTEKPFNQIKNQIGINVLSITCFLDEKTYTNYISEMVLFVKKLRVIFPQSTFGLLHLPNTFGKR